MGSEVQPSTIIAPVRQLPAALRASARWGLERVQLLHGGGATGLARELQCHLRHLPVVVLHDRRLPGDAGVLEHVAVGPGGVTAIAGAGVLAGPLRVHRIHGVFGASAELLQEGEEDRTALVAPVHAQVVALRRLAGEGVPVTGALCIEDVPAALLRPLEVNGVTVAGSRAIARLASRDGGLTDTELADVVDRLAAACPPAL